MSAAMPLPVVAEQPTPPEGGTVIPSPVPVVSLGADRLVRDLEQFYARIAAYLKPEDLARVKAAYEFSHAAHRGQLRVSGEAYVSHPLAVAGKLADWHLDAQALCAALLHDVMEDTEVTKAQLAEQFGKVAADLVDGVSKLDRLEHQTFEEAQAESLRKMLLAMARDVRVILIKLADRLHNMQTLGAMPAAKRYRIAHETLDIYAPIAHRLGLNALYRELQELSFLNLYPMRYRVLERAVRGARGNRRAAFDRILDAIRKALPENGVEAEVVGREKLIFSIYSKMREKHLTFSQVLDIYGFRIIVPDTRSCYVALGVLHNLFKPIPGKFKDYIAIPKANGYQSLHTALISPLGTPLEIQIRTRDMHHVAESGVAAHWMYKDQSALDDLQKRTHKWLQSLIELQSNSGDSSEFLEHVKVDLFAGEVFVFTPRGKIIALPSGSTAVDFAYAVHTSIGDHCIACRINYETQPLRTELRNGDRVEIITAPSAGPNPAWLSYVRSSRARSRIRHYLKTQQNEESAALGERLLGHALRSIGIDPRELPEAAWERFQRDLGGNRTKRSVLADIGLGKRLPAIVARRLAEGLATRPVADSGEPGEISGRRLRRPDAILIHGPDGTAVQLATCCRPIPGDPIVGLIHKGQGLVIHTHDCSSVARIPSERGNWVDVAWEPGIHRMFETTLRVVADNSPGVLARLAAAIAGTESNIVNVSMDDDRGTTTAIYFTLQVTDRSHLARILRAMRRVPEVMKLGRFIDRQK